MADKNGTDASQASRRSAVISFMNVTKVKREEAIRCLEQADWDYDKAVRSFFDEDLEFYEIPAPDPPDQRVPSAKKQRRISNEQERKQRRISDKQERACSPMASYSEGPRIATLSSLHQQQMHGPERAPAADDMGCRIVTIDSLRDSEDPDDGQAFYAGGSVRSGQQVLGPGKKDESGKTDQIVEEMLKAAKKQGEQIAKPDSAAMPATPLKVFSGIGHVLGSSVQSSSDAFHQPDLDKTTTDSNEDIEGVNISKKLEIDADTDVDIGSDGNQMDSIKDVGIGAKGFGEDDEMEEKSETASSEENVMGKDEENLMEPGEKASEFDASEKVDGTCKDVNDPAKDGKDVAAEDGKDAAAEDGKDTGAGDQIDLSENHKKGITEEPEDVPMEQEENSSLENPLEKEKLPLRVRLYRNGFVIGDGPLRSYEDPENREMLDAFSKGRVPEELTMFGGGDMALELEDLRSDSYLPEMPRSQVVAFSGVGHRLGSPTPPVSVQKSNHYEKEEEKAKELLKLDKSSPTTVVKVKLDDGSRLSVELNLHHTIGDLRRYIVVARPEYSASVFELCTSYPTKELKDYDATIGDEDICNSLLVQKIK